MGFSKKQSEQSMVVDRQMSSEVHKESQHFAEPVPKTNAPRYKIVNYEFNSKVSIQIFVVILNLLILAEQPPF